MTRTARYTLVLAIAACAALVAPAGAGATPPPTAVVSVSSSANPSVYGEDVTITADISPSSGSTLPTGTIACYDGATVIGAGMLSQLSGSTAQAQCVGLPFSVGDHTITVDYLGDGTYAEVDGAAMTGNPQVVNLANTTTTVTTSGNPFPWNQVGGGITATVNAVSPGSGTPTGTVTFYDNGNSLTTQPLVSGAVTLAPSWLTPGSHTITATYNGDSNFNTSDGSLTGNPQLVTKASSSMTLTSSQNPSAYGSAVTFTATVTIQAIPAFVTGAAAFPQGSYLGGGTVTVFDGGTAIGSGTLTGWPTVQKTVPISPSTTLTTSALLQGSHNITAVYNGNADINGANASLTGQSQVVTGAPPTVSIATPAAGATFTQGQVVDAAYSCNDGAGGPGISSCKGTVANGAAIDTSTVGSHTFTVTAASSDGKSATGTATYVVAPGRSFRVTHAMAPVTGGGGNGAVAGTVTFQLQTPGSGTVDVLETAGDSALASVLEPGPHRFVLGRRHLEVSGPLTQKVSVHLSAAGRRALRDDDGHGIRINLWVTYTPTGGKPMTHGVFGLLVR